jgi:hypothetical protein
MSFQDSDSGLGYGLEGKSAKRIGVVGKSDSGPGVLGESHESFDTNKIISGTSVGVMGAARTGSGVLGFSEDATGVAGGSIKGIGVYGIGSQVEGVRGLSAKSDGVHGIVSNDNASGVRGTNNLTGDGVSGTSQGGNGVYGETDTLGNVPSQGKVGSGVFGLANPWGYGVLGYSPRGPAAVSGFSDEGFGVFGQSNSDSGIGVYGRGGDVKGVGVSGQGRTGMAGTGTSLGVVGNGSTGIQGNGDPNYGIGVSGTGSTGVSGTGILGVQGQGDPSFGIGVSGSGFVGLSGDGFTGVMGGGDLFGVAGTLKAGAGGVLGAGVGGMGTSTQTGVSGISENGRGIWGQSTNGSGIEGYSTAGHAGWFNGDVNINGKLSKSGGGFKIDHPLAPEAMYLNHSFVESPDMKNFYDGEVVLGPNGDATVELPRWFEALNADFHYQLTPIGGGAPQLHIASEVRRGRFRIAGGRQGLNVCWQVTGTRQDAWARRNRIKVEEKKTKTERGKYRHPEAFRKPEELSVQWARDPNLLRMLLKHRKRGASLMSTYLVLREAMANKGNRNAGVGQAKGGVSRKK